MPTILSISSQTVRGRVGNSIAIPAFQALGIDARALPTVIADAPGRGPASGALDEAHFDALLARAEHFAAELAAVHIGYLRTAAQAERLGRFLTALRSRNPRPLLTVDPVMGDSQTGLYIDEAAAQAVERLIVPLADAITPNLWELERLSGMRIASERDVIAAASRVACPRVVCTSAPARAADEISTMLVEAGVAMVARAPRFESAPHGTGDLLAALFAGRVVLGEGPAAALGAAAASLHDLIAAAREMKLGMLPVVERAGLLRQPQSRIVPRLLGGQGDSEWVAGADGCRGGWVVALGRPEQGGAVATRLVADFAELAALPERPRVIAVDCPIGLPRRAIKGGREACNIARSRIGERQSSVFSVPARAALAAASYAEACSINLQNSDPPRKIAKQTYNILPRIAEVDALMTSALQTRVFECHPELAFSVMNGDEPLGLPKKLRSRPYTEGMALRRKLLKRAGLADPPAPSPRAGIAYGEDDLLDACACLFAARRIALGQAERLPLDPPLDEKGLRMEIVA